MTSTTRCTDMSLQDLFTVVPSELTANAYATSASTCRGNLTGSWVTPPRSTLNVQVEGQYGNLATNGWPAACKPLRPSRALDDC
jgi:hypothetical protein